MSGEIGKMLSAGKILSAVYAGCRGMLHMNIIEYSYILTDLLH